MLKKIAILLLALPLIACAVGNKYQYQNAEMALPVAGDLAVGISVEDNRPYVVSGDKKPTFVGIQRGGFGNPFDVTTGSGKPLADDVSTAIVKGLIKNGYEAQVLEITEVNETNIANAAAANSVDKVILLKINEWKTDVMASVNLGYDLVLSVFNKNGELVAETASQGKEGIGGGGFESKNSLSAISALEQKISYLFNDPKIKSELE